MVALNKTGVEKFNNLRHVPDGALIYPCESSLVISRSGGCEILEKTVI